jgi:hypothetical protein
LNLKIDFIWRVIMSDKNKTHLGIQLPREEREFIQKGADKYKMKVSDYARRVLRLGTSEDIIKKDFVTQT